MERRTALKKSYHTISTQGQTNSKRLAEFFSRHGQGLLPMVDLIEQSRLAVDELIDIAGRATIEAVLQLSAEQVAGPRTPGQRRRGLLWHGRQAGRVCLKERKLGVTKPRLREKGGGEVAIPAYEAMQENGMSQRMLDVLMRGISTRQYAEVLPEMASTCGVSKSTVSREAAEAGEEALKELLERRFDGDRSAGDLPRRDAIRRASCDQCRGCGSGRTQARAGYAAGSDRKRGGGGGLTGAVSGAWAWTRRPSACS